MDNTVHRKLTSKNAKAHKPHPLWVAKDQGPGTFHVRWQEKSYQVGIVF